MKKNESSQSKIFDIVLVIIICISAFLLGLNVQWRSSSSVALDLTKEERVIAKKYEILYERLNTHELKPSQWASVQYIKYNFHDPDLEKKLGRIKFPVQALPRGLYSIEIDFVTIDKKNFLLQIGVFEISSQNKIFETSENFSFEG